MLAVLSDAYRRQYGLESCVPVLANLYGPGRQLRPRGLARDRGDGQQVRHRPRRRTSPQVVLWGTGEPTREFLYVDDAARALLLAAEHADTSEPFNVGTGTETRIRDLADAVSRLAGYEGETVWDSSRPDGQPRRFLDVSRAREWIGFEAMVELEEGLRQTIESFREGLRVGSAVE